MIKKIIFMLPWLLLTLSAQAQTAPSVTGAGDGITVVMDVGCSPNDEISSLNAGKAEIAADLQAMAECESLDPSLNHAVRINDYTYQTGCQRFGPWYSSDKYVTRATAQYSCLR